LLRLTFSVKGGFCSTPGDRFAGAGWLLAVGGAWLTDSNCDQAEFDAGYGLLDGLEQLADDFNRLVHVHCGFPGSPAVAVSARSLALSTISAWPRLSASSASWLNLMPWELGAATRRTE
jgi:hypothetical protein